MTEAAEWLTQFTMTKPKRYRLHDSLGYRLSVAARLQERRLDDGLRPLGLSRITWCVLLAVGNEELLQPSEIADFVGIDRTATSRALRQMESAGLIRRQTGTDDRRTTAVYLTDLGGRLLAEGTPLAVENNAIMESRLTPEESEEMRRLLQKINAGEDIALSRL